MIKIYTGYAWREAKPEEIELITPDRIIESMTDEAQAGDIYEEETEVKAVPLGKCKWCNGSGTERAHFFDTGYRCPDCHGTGYAWGPEAVEYVEYLISKEFPEGE